MDRKERRRQQRVSGVAVPNQEKAQNTARARVRAAELHLSNGKPVAAADALKDALTLDPENAQAWYLSAMLAFNSGDLSQAADAIVKSIANGNTDPSAHANCSAIMNMGGRPEDAEKAARMAIQLAPEMPEAHCNLGVALEALGDTEAAEQALLRAVELNAEYTEAYISLGNLLYRKQDYLSSVDAFAHAVALQPENPMAHTNLGIALRAIGDLTAAENHCRKAVALNPAYAEGQNALGNVLRDLGHAEGALIAFKAAIANRDVYPEARVNLAGALYKLGQLDAAETTYSDALARHPGFADAAHGLGVVRLARGKTKEALEVFREAVARRESFGEAWMNIVDADGVHLSEQDFQVLRARSEDTRLSDEDRTAFLFALGAAEDKQGDYTAAAAAYNKANRRRRSALATGGYGFDPDAFDDEVANVISTFEDWPTPALSKSGDAEANLIFICGMPRSGTSLVEQVLGAHPSIQGAGEVDILSGLLDDYPTMLRSLSPQDVRNLADLYLARLPIKPGPDIFVTDKTPKNIFFAGVISVLFPQAKIIHCQRNRRDVALSCYFQNFKSIGMNWSFDLAHIQRFQIAETRIAEYWKANTLAPITTIDYDAMVSNLDQQVVRLCDYIGIEYDEQMLSPHTAESTVLTASNWQVRTPVHTKSVNKSDNYSDLLALPDV